MFALVLIHIIFAYAQQRRLRRMRAIRRMREMEDEMDEHEEFLLAQAADYFASRRMSNLQLFGRPFVPRMRLRFDDISELGCKERFRFELTMRLAGSRRRSCKVFCDAYRFEKEHVIMLIDRLQLPLTIRCKNGLVFNSTEGFCLLLERLAVPKR